MKARGTKLEFLARVIASTRTRFDGPSPVMTGDEFARDNVLVACEAIQLGLVRLYRDDDGYELRITRAGRLLAAGQIDEAAASIDSGTSVTRLLGDPPEGLLGTRLYPGSQGIHLNSSSARQFAPEMMRGVATGHLVVSDGVIRAVDPAGISQTSPRVRAARLGRNPAPSPPGIPVEVPTAELPSSRSGRHVSVRHP